MPDHEFGFDHLIHWVDDLDGTTAAYDALGLQTHDVLTMPGFRNAAWAVDDTRYVELATVDDWQAVATSKFAEGMAILKPAVAALDGSGLLTFAVNVPDARATTARLRESGYTTDDIEVQFEEPKVGFVEVFVRDAPAYFPFFITYYPPRAELARMRAEYRAANDITFDGQPDLTALLVHSPEPEDDARRLGELLNCAVAGATVALPGAEVRFEQATSTCLHGIAVRGLDPSAGPQQIAGMTVRPEA